MKKLLIIISLFGVMSCKTTNSFKNGEVVKFENGKYGLVVKGDNSYNIYAVKIKDTSNVFFKTGFLDSLEIK